MEITFVDAATLGDDIDLSPFEQFGKLNIYKNCSPENLPERIKNSDIIVTNKVRFNGGVLKYAKKLKIICLAATGYDPVDINYCREHSIAVCNVVGYSTDSVAQITVSMALELINRMREYTGFTASGEYSKSGLPNRVSPCYHEISGKVWGIVGLGNIGKKVAAVASALGCRVICCKNTPEKGYDCVDIDTLIESSDIISLHVPLTENTRNLINKERITKMKKGVILINAARGAVTDEKAIADSVISGHIGGFGCDVYSVEPFGEDHPFYKIKDYCSVCLTPHMAWAAYEARVRCMDEIILNIKAFFNGEIRNRVELI